jgi:hypothetical protein
VAHELPGGRPPTYEELLADVLARVPVHTPEWTNLGPGDPGVTILELFAYLTAELIHEAGAISERSRRQFLSLLSTPVQPAAPATGFVTFATADLIPAVIPPDQEIRAGLIPFQTRVGTDTLPVDAFICIKQKREAPASAEPGAIYYETTPLAAPADGLQLPTYDLGNETVDQSLWIALLARKPEQVEQTRAAVAGRTLNVGVLPALPPVRRLPPLGLTGATARQSLVAEMATDRFDEDGEPLYRRLPVLQQVDVLAKAGILGIQLPDLGAFRLWQLADKRLAGTGDLPPLAPAVANRLVTWLRLRAPGSEAGVRARLHWAGINADMVEQRVRVTGELVGDGTGEPNQVLTLVNRPVLPGTVRLRVGSRPWQETEELYTAGPEVPLQNPALPPGRRLPEADARVFAVDPATGEIRFGDGLRGARPGKGEPIEADYAYGGGKAGNLPAGQLKKAPGLPVGVSVNNPLPTWGGTDRQSLADAERLVPAALRHRDRLITLDDFAHIVLDTPGVSMGRVEILPLVHPDSPGQKVPGAVTVLVLPEVAEPSPTPIRPGSEFLDLIGRHVDARRLITTDVTVTGPVYRSFAITVGLEVAAGSSFAAVADGVRRALTGYLSPLTGGAAGQGWPLAKLVRARELLAQADRVEGVGIVTDLLMTTEDGASVTEVPLSGLELPWVTAVHVHDASPGAPPVAPAASRGARRIIAAPIQST